jgi:hypothetical protein
VNEPVLVTLDTGVVAFAVTAKGVQHG